VGLHRCCFPNFHTLEANQPTPIPATGVPGSEKPKCRGTLFPKPFPKPRQGNHPVKTVVFVGGFLERTLPPQKKNSHPPESSPRFPMFFLVLDAKGTKTTGVSTTLSQLWESHLFPPF